MRGVEVGAKREENQWVSFKVSTALGGGDVLKGDETMTFVISFWFLLIKNDSWGYSVWDGHLCRWTPVLAILMVLLWTKPSSEGFYRGTEVGFYGICASCFFLHQNRAMIWELLAYRSLQLPLLLFQMSSYAPLQLTLHLLVGCFTLLSLALGAVSKPCTASPHPSLVKGQPWIIADLHPDF